MIDAEEQSFSNKMFVQNVGVGGPVAVANEGTQEIQQESEGAEDSSRSSASSSSLTSRVREGIRQLTGRALSAWLMWSSCWPYGGGVSVLTEFYDLRCIFSHFRRFIEW